MFKKLSTIQKVASHITPTGRKRRAQREMVKAVGGLILTVAGPAVIGQAAGHVAQSAIRRVIRPRLTTVQGRMHEDTAKKSA